MQDEVGGIGAVRFGQAITRDRARRGEQEMHRSALMKLVLVVGVLVVTLALTGCSSGVQNRRKPRLAPYRRTRRPFAPVNTARRSSSPRSPSRSARAGTTCHWRPPTSWPSQ